MSERQDTLTKVLAYVDSPFKLFALILMAIFAFAGYIIYDNREVIVGTYKEHQKLPQIAEGRVDDAATHLFKHTNAQVVAIFKVNPIVGSRVLYRAYTKEGRDKTVEGLDVGLFTSNANNNKDVVALMANEIPCGEYKAAQSEVGLWYIEKGMTFGCRVSSNLLRSLPIRLPIHAAGINKYIFFSGKKLKRFRKETSVDRSGELFGC